MTPDVVVDIGNSRLKWGRCTGNRVVEVLRLPLDDERAWDAALVKLSPPALRVRKWSVASVNPPALGRFLRWSATHGHTVVFENVADVPIRINVDEPGKVGLDRLFGAIAAACMVPANVPAITVDVGTAATVNLIDGEGVFQGGAILPGPRLMGRALNEFTAKLPFVEPTEWLDPRPGKNTGAAIRLGIHAALIGGVQVIVNSFAVVCLQPPWLFLAGGAQHLLTGLQATGVAQIQAVPTLTLEGIRIAAEALP